MSGFPWHLSNLDVTLEVRVVDLADGKAWLGSIRDELDLGWTVLQSCGAPALVLGLVMASVVGVPRVRVVSSSMTVARTTKMACRMRLLLWLVVRALVMATEVVSWRTWFRGTARVGERGLV